MGKGTLMPDQEWQSAPPSMGGEGSEARSQARELKQDASEAYEESKHRAEEFAQEQKQRVCENLNSASSAIHQAAQKLREDHHDQMARYGDIAADEISRIAQRLESRDSKGLLSELEDFGKRRPGAFLAVAMLGGVALGRVLRNAGAGESQQSQSIAA